MKTVAALKTRPLTPKQVRVLLRAGYDEPVHRLTFMQASELVGVVLGGCR